MYHAYGHMARSTNLVIAATSAAEGTKLPSTALPALWFDGADERLFRIGKLDLRFGEHVASAAIERTRPNTGKREIGHQSGAALVWQANVLFGGRARLVGITRG